MKVVLVNRFFHPDLAPTARLASEVAFDLAAAGVEAHAVTGRLGYDDPRDRLPDAERVSGVQIHRVWSTRFGRGSLAGRALDYLSFYAASFLRLLALLRRGDVVVAKTDPPLLSVCAALAAWLKGAILVNWLQDLFPEVAAQSGMRWAAGPAGAVARLLRDWSLRRAAANVAIGALMGELIERRVPGAEVRVIPNWSDGATLHPLGVPQALRRQRGFDGRFVVGHSGNYGRVHDADTVIDAARLLQADEGIAFSIVGGGYRFGQLRAARLRNLVMRDYAVQSDLAESLATCDVHLVTLLPALEGLVVPSKFYSALAVGLPVIFVGHPEGELARSIRAHDCGLVVSSGDAAALVEAIRRLRSDAAQRKAMGARGRALFEERYDRPIGLARWRELITSLPR